MYPEFSTVCVLLAHNAMTIIKCMIDFITIPGKIEAHSEVILLEKISKFIKVINKKKDNSSVLWPYYRILNPTDGDFNIANFPNLGVCSIEYQKKFDSDTFKNIVTPNMVLSGIVKKALTQETRDIFTRPEEARMSEKAIAGAREIGLDLQKLTMTRSAYTRLRPETIDPETIQDIINAFQRFSQVKR